jgi:phage replication O-like protein O
MSIPQTENGFTRISNELLEAILGSKFTERQIKVIFSIIRKTYGFGKKTDDMSASQIGIVCNMNRNHVTECLNKLSLMRVITKTPGKYGCFIGLNKHYKTWDLGSPKSGLVPNQDSPKEGLLLVPSRDFASPKSGHTKENLQKKTSKENGEFEIFWKSYPKKVAKQDALKAWNKLNPNLEVVLKALAWQVRLDDWLKDAGKFIPYPASYLNSSRWEDEPVVSKVNIPAAQKTAVITERPILKESDRDAAMSLKDVLRRVGQ